ncbi:Gfo/Idh/MocA family protein [Paenibacillus senegalensis]|uniref:Gfo/Idh/MocA family protein n=1 Tax=Paenibacillus senegalensis TaxID=1465766 RepID=UPI00028A3B67|nr:Gfo/Idh/MocA family oxidoreductase [Paenibacillus senegalensis]
MIRFGVIGTNWITEAFLQAASGVEGCQLTAVYSRTEERARQFAEKHGAPYWFTDLKAMAASDQLDAVYIASPNAFHAEQAILYMEHGKHVLCEKPMASNVLEVQQMVAAAGRNKVVLMEALKSTLTPGFAAIQEQLPKLGTIRRYFASYGQYSSRYDAYKQGNVLNAFKPELSNGSLMDLGVYCVYPLAVLFGRPEKLQANGLKLTSGADGQGSLLLHYPDMEGVILHSKIAHSYLPSEIQGEDAALVIDRINDPQHITLHYRDGSKETVFTHEENTDPAVSNTMVYEVQEFVSLIRKGQLQSSVNSHLSSLIAAEMMEEARRQFGLRYPADE